MRFEARMGRGAAESTVTIDVCCKVHSISFSAHADAKGILSLVRTLRPSVVVLVHGERLKIRFLRAANEGLSWLPWSCERRATAW